jgi:hypothetical protein
MRTITMPSIVIRCPITQAPVPTGLTTEAILLDSLDDDLTLPLRCPACRKLHHWKKRDAWVDGSPRR